MSIIGFTQLILMANNPANKEKTFALSFSVAFAGPADGIFDFHPVYLNREALEMGFWIGLLWRKGSYNICIIASGGIDAQNELAKIIIEKMDPTRGASASLVRIVGQKGADRLVTGDISSVLDRANSTVSAVAFGQLAS